MKEKWVPVYGYEKFYEVSDKGNVRSLPRTIYRKDGSVWHKPGTPMKTYVNENGYVIVRLTDESSSKLWRVHRLVLLSFIGPVVDKPIANHKNGDKLKNWLSNLEWSTSKENNEHAIRTGLRKSNYKNKEIHIAVDKYDFVTESAGEAANKLHDLGYFKNISFPSLRSSLGSCAKRHRLFYGKVRCEYTDDPYDIPAKYKSNGVKGHPVWAMIQNGCVFKAKGITKLVKKMRKMGYWTDGKFHTVVAGVSEAAIKRKRYRGILVWYSDKDTLY